MKMRDVVKIWLESLIDNFTLGWLNSGGIPDTGIPWASGDVGRAFPEGSGLNSLNTPIVPL